MGAVISGYPTATRQEFKPLTLEDLEASRRFSRHHRASAFGPPGSRGAGPQALSTIGPDSRRASTVHSQKSSVASSHGVRASPGRLEDRTFSFGPDARLMSGAAEHGEWMYNLDQLGKEHQEREHKNGPRAKHTPGAKHDHQQTDHAHQQGHGHHGPGHGGHAHGGHHDHSHHTTSSEDH